MVELAKGFFLNLANLTKNLQKATVGKKSFNLISLLHEREKTEPNPAGP